MSKALEKGGVAITRDDERALVDAFAEAVKRRSLEQLDAAASAPETDDEVVTLGLDLGRAQRLAVRDLLAPDAFVHLPVVARYMLPPLALEALEAARERRAGVQGPRAPASIAHDLMQVLVDLAAAKSECYQVTDEAGARQLYDRLNGILTAVAAAQTKIAALAVEPKTIRGRAELTVGIDDAVITCPELERNVSVLVFCSACTWIGPEMATCRASHAKAVVALVHGSQRQ